MRSTVSWWWNFVRMLRNRCWKMRMQDFTISCKRQSGKACSWAVSGICGRMHDRRYDDISADLWSAGCSCAQHKMQEDFYYSRDVMIRGRISICEENVEKTACHLKSRKRFGILKKEEPISSVFLLQHKLWRRHIQMHQKTGQAIWYLDIKPAIQYSDWGWYGYGRTQIHSEWDLWTLSGADYDRKTDSVRLIL